MVGVIVIVSCKLAEARSISGQNVSCARLAPRHCIRRVGNENRGGSNAETSFCMAMLASVDIFRLSSSQRLSSLIVLSVGKVGVPAGRSSASSISKRGAEGLKQVAAISAN